MDVSPEQLPGTAALLWRSLVKRPPRLDPEQRIEAQGLCVAPFALDRERLHRFARFHGVAEPGMLSAWYPLFQPAHLALFARPELPLRAAGTVHAGNRITRHGDALLPLPDTELELRVMLKGDTLHRRGRELHLRTELHDHRHCLISMDSDYFVREAPRDCASRKVGDDLEPAMSEQQSLSFGADYGRRYARLSGDWNPIHLHPWTSRLFGFRQPIAHGVSVMAAIEACRLAAGSPPLRSIAVRFLRPLTLPGCASLSFGEQGFALSDAQNEVLQRGEWSL